MIHKEKNDLIYNLFRRNLTVDSVLSNLVQTTKFIVLGYLEGFQLSILYLVKMAHLLSTPQTTFNIGKIVLTNRTISIYCE